MTLLAKPAVDDAPIVFDPPPDEAAEARALELAGRLTKALDDRAPLIIALRNYRDGKHPMSFATKKWRETFGRDFGMVVDNWCRIVVDAAIERMAIHGFRFGMADDVLGAPKLDPAADPATPDAAAADVETADADEAAWEIWQRNRLDLDSDLAHTEMLSTGYSYTLVWPDEDTGEPTITVEDPLQTIVLHDPANRRKRVAGFKRWRELDGSWQALLFTPEMVWEMAGGKGTSPQRWAVTAATPNQLGLVPILEFLNDPDIYGRGTSAFEAGVPLNDAINKLMADMLVASEFTSYRQRVLIGVEIPVGADGQPDKSIIGGVNRWIGLEAAVDDEGKQVTPSIQELQTSDLSSYVNGIELLTQHFAALTRTPPHYLLAKLINVSADALIASQDGLVARTRRAMRFAGETWEEALRIAFLIKGDIKRAEAWGAETMWADPETTSEAQRVDALVKLKTIGVPQRALWELDGRSPQTIKRWRRWAQEEAQLDGLRLGISGASGLPPEPPPPDAAAAAAGA